ncbi:MAG: tRNA N6-adenosine threonylcarbamoyltransferase [Thermodesulfobacteriota bacterium]|nr:MAG: tRNA N6-adenosine threonylcarbamoyltransferase [Thermodesulfobacteriota bacterium]
MKESSKIDGMSSNLLAIESSCDETSAAVIQDGTKVLSNIVASQIDIHKEYGGVVPEIASRKHVELIMPVVDKAIKESGIKREDIDGVAVTHGPGLIGALMVGLSTAKAIAFGLNIPLIGVNHLEAHMSAVHLENEVPFPFVGLVVSGGHTSLYLVKSHTEFEMLGKTRDDAAGEAFDKAAKIMGLPYPGGIEIDKLAKEGNRGAIPFPRPFMTTSTFDFSFSGVKTSVLYYLRKHPDPNNKELKDICASYQEAIVETLVDKTLLAAKENHVKSVVIAGGVACNSRLRELSKEKLEEEGISVYIPSPKYCTDNAAMIGSLGGFMFKNGTTSKLSLTPFSTSRPKQARGRGSQTKTA